MSSPGDPGDALARRLGKARAELALRERMVMLPEVALAEAHRWIEAAAQAGIAIAVVDQDNEHSRTGSPASTGSSVPAVLARVTATVRGTDNRPLERDDYASHLQAVVDLGRGGQRHPMLTTEEGEAVAALLDELSGVYPDEDLGRLARELAVTINGRLGI